MRLLSATSELLKKAVEMHGHLGPFLVIGLRMSLLAEKLLSGKPDKCKAMVIQRKPFFCSVDGMKAVVGVERIKISGGKGISAIFGRENNEAQIEVKESVLKRYGPVPWEKCEEEAREVLRSSDEELFTWIAHSGR